MQIITLGIDMLVAGFVFLSPPLLASRLKQIQLSPQTVNFYLLISYAVGTCTLGFISDRLGRKGHLLLNKALLLAGCSFGLFIQQGWSYILFCVCSGLSLGPSNTLVLIVAMQLNDITGPKLVQILIGFFSFAGLVQGFLIKDIQSLSIFIICFVLIPTAIQAIFIIIYIEQTLPIPAQRFHCPNPILVLTLVAIIFCLQLIIYSWILQLTAYGFLIQYNYLLIGITDLIAGATVYYCIDKLPQAYYFRIMGFIAALLIILLSLNIQSKVLSAFCLASLRFVMDFSMGIFGVVLPRMIYKQVRGTMNNLVMGIGSSGGALGPLLPGSTQIKSLISCFIIIISSFIL